MANTTKTNNSILFLDIDGVLNTDSFRSAYGNNAMHPYLVLNLDSIIVEVGCLIVISSDWRKPHAGGLKQIHESLKCSEFVEATPEKVHKRIVDSIIDVTPDICWREKEIYASVQKHAPDRWLAVDDMLLDLDNDHVVQTDPRYGLTQTIAQDIIKRFKA